MAEEQKKTRTRNKRRNFAKELAEIEAYCKVSIEILNSEPHDNPFVHGQINAFGKILSKMGTSNAR